VRSTLTLRANPKVHNQIDRKNDAQQPIELRSYQVEASGN
jgi:hypothetical protein